MSRIIDYPKTQLLNSTGETFLVDHSTSGTRGITAGYLSQNLQETTSRNFKNYRNSFYRAMDLGTEFTSEQNAAISGSSPNFANMYVGAYWTINGHRYRIAHFDYWYNKYDKLDGTSSTNDHHIMLMYEPSGSYKMNETASTDGGYYNSYMHTVVLNEMLEIIRADWGDHLLTHRCPLVNSVVDGTPSTYAWVDTIVEIPNEMMVYGTFMHGGSRPNASIINANGVTVDNKAAAYFSLGYNTFSTRIGMWLRDVVSPTEYAYALSYGVATSGLANAEHPIRPMFGVKAV